MPKAKFGPEVGNTMAVALARTLLAKGLLTHDDARAMVAQMHVVADGAQEKRPLAAAATRTGARSFQHALTVNPGVEFPLMLTPA